MTADEVRTSNDPSSTRQLKVRLATLPGAISCCLPLMFMYTLLLPSALPNPTVNAPIEIGPALLDLSSNFRVGCKNSANLPWAAVSWSVKLLFWLVSVAFVFVRFLLSVCAVFLCFTTC